MNMLEKRVPYETIKAWVLEAYFDFCRDRGVVQGRPPADIMGAVSYEYEVCFERPIERFMFEVIYIVLSGGWYELPMAYHYEQIQKLITEYGLENLLVDVPEDEAKLFRHDLRILKLI